MGLIPAIPLQCLVLCGSWCRRTIVGGRRATRTLSEGRVLERIGFRPARRGLHPKVDFRDWHQDIDWTEEEWIRNCTQRLLHPEGIKPIAFITRILSCRPRLQETAARAENRDG